MASFSVILLGLAALFSGITVIFIVIALQSSRERRNTIFPIVYENEGIKARRFGILAVIFAALTALLLGGWVATQQNPDNVLTANKATTQAQTSESASSISISTQPTQKITKPTTATTAVVQPGQIDPSAFSDAPTNTPESVELPQPTATQPAASPDEPTVTPSPVASLVPAPEGATIGPIAFARSVTEDREPLDPGEVFDLQAEKIYAAFPYSGMKNGVPFAAVWYYEDQEIFRDEYIWNWGISDRSYVFIRPKNAGAYRIELILGDDILANGAFEILP